MKNIILLLFASLLFSCSSSRSFPKFDAKASKCFNHCQAQNTWVFLQRTEQCVCYDGK
jgi:hypothetical protein